MIGIKKTDKEIQESILDRAIVYLKYRETDSFLYCTFFTRNTEVIKKIFPDNNFTFSKYKNDRLDAVDLRTGDLRTLEINELSFGYFPEFPFELSPVFLFNPKYTDKLSAKDVMSFQKNTITQLKKFKNIALKIKDSKEREDLNKILSPKAAFLKTILPGCRLLDVAPLDAFKLDKVLVKKAFKKYHEELLKHYDYVIDEINAEKTVLYKKIKRGCKFSKDSLNEVLELEKKINKERIASNKLKFSCIYEMLCYWPESLIPAPDYIITEPSNECKKIISTLKLSIPRDALVDYYKNLCSSISDWYSYAFTTDKNTEIFNKIVGIKEEDEFVHFISIPTYNILPTVCDLKVFPEKTIKTNANFIHCYTFKKDVERGDYYLFSDNNTSMTTPNAIRFKKIDNTHIELTFNLDNQDPFTSRGTKLSPITNTFEILDSFIKIAD
jgi:hypothetical protein